MSFLKNKNFVKIDINLIYNFYKNFNNFLKMDQDDNYLDQKS